MSDRVRTTTRVAALYVDVERGPYARMPGVEAWGVERDATAYDGPWPVVSHPPCGPWSRLHHMCGPGLLAQKGLGPIAIEQVRRWGGVLEHPRDSKLWAACGMPKPGEDADRWGGRTILVEQWWWGHRAVKPTWLYVVGGSIPSFPEPSGDRPVSGGKRARKEDPSQRPMLERLSKHERHLTPLRFAEWLVGLAESCAREVV